MEKHQAGRVRDRLSLTLPAQLLIYTPIEDWRNDEVWIYLNQWQNLGETVTKTYSPCIGVLQQITDAPRNRLQL